MNSMQVWAQQLPQDTTFLLDEEHLRQIGIPVGPIVGDLQFRLEAPYYCEGTADRARSLIFRRGCVVISVDITPVESIRPLLTIVNIIRFIDHDFLCFAAIQIEADGGGEE
jgi:hypothetical protein